MLLTGFKKIQCYCRYLLLPGTLISSVVNAQILEQIEVIEDVPGLSGVASIEITADGKHLYTASPSDELIGVYSRDIDTGALTLIETEAIDIGIVSPFGPPGPMAKLFQNERFLLVSQFSGVPPRLFSRSQTTGELELLDDDYFSLAENERISAIAFNNQGDNLYVLLRTGLLNSLRSYSINSAGESTLIDSIDIGEGLVSGVVVISPDDRHVYVQAGATITLRLIRDATSGLLTVAGNEPDLAGIESLSPVFSVDGLALHYIGFLGGNPNALGVLRRDPESGRLTRVLIETGLVGFNSDVTDDSMSLFADERLLVTHDGPNLFRLLPDDAGYVDLTDQIGGSLPTGPVGRGALEFSPDEAFMYLGLVSFMRGSDGIRIYRNNGLMVPQAVPVPALGLTGVCILLLTMLFLSIVWRRIYYNKA